MLNENIKAQRKAKGLTQEELATKLNVARQTLSKWETGLSVPDAEMLVRIAEVLDVSVNELLGESCTSESNNDSLKILAAKLGILNKQYSRSREQKRKIWRVVSIILAIIGIVYLFERVWTAGIIFRALTNPNLGANRDTLVKVSDIPGSAYRMALSVCARMILPPVIICIIAAIGVYKTKVDV